MAQRRGESEGTILVIDDELDALKLTKLTLERRGYRVLTAADGKEGLMKAKVEEPDVILLDIIMPKMGGHEVLQQLKRDPDTKKIPVLVVTAKGAERDRARSYELGAVDHVEKPFGTKELAKKVAMALVLVKKEKSGDKGQGAQDKVA